MKENQASALTIVADRTTKRKNRYACKIACIAEFFYQIWFAHQREACLKNLIKGYQSVVKTRTRRTSGTFGISVISSSVATSA